MAGSRSYRYRIVDVFTSRALEGNPLAVFLDSDGLDGVTMQRIAKEMNLSETVFIGAPTRAGCAVGVRIFTPGRELAFAGHPTVGTAYVLLDEGVVPQGSVSFALDEKVGAVPVRVEPGDPPLIWLSTPPISWGRSYNGSLCAQALGLDPGDLLEITPRTVSAGTPVIFIALKDKLAVDRAWLDSSGFALLKSRDEGADCVFVFTPTAEGAYSRMFAPAFGIAEDPATGGATGPLAAFMMEHKLVSGASGSRFVSEQGVKMDRRSILHIEIRGDQGRDGIDVGGHVAPVSKATMIL
jgi:trans-2,3-dihydro-3-hydroxyanthranilate isomerase